MWAVPRSPSERQAGQSGARPSMLVSPRLLGKGNQEAPSTLSPVSAASHSTGLLG